MSDALTQSPVNLTSTRTRLGGGVEIEYEIGGQSHTAIVTIRTGDVFWEIQGLTSEMRFPGGVRPRSLEHRRFVMPGEYALSPTLPGLAFTPETMVIPANEPVTELDADLVVTEVGEGLAKQVMVESLGLCPAVDLPCPEWDEPGMSVAWWSDAERRIAEGLALEVTDPSVDHFGGMLADEVPVRFVRDAAYVDEMRQVSVEMFVDLTVDEP